MNAFADTFALMQVTRIVLQILDCGYCGLQIELPRLATAARRELNRVGRRQPRYRYLGTLCFPARPPLWSVARWGHQQEGFEHATNFNGMTICIVAMKWTIEKKTRLTTWSSIHSICRQRRRYCRNSPMHCHQPRLKPLHAELRRGTHVKMAKMVIQKGGPP